MEGRGNSNTTPLTRPLHPRQCGNPPALTPGPYNSGVSKGLPHLLHFIVTKPCGAIWLSQTNSERFTDLQKVTQPKAQPTASLRVSSPSTWLSCHVHQQMFHAHGFPTAAQYLSLCCVCRRLHEHHGGGFHAAVLTCATCGASEGSFLFWNFLKKL